MCLLAKLNRISPKSLSSAGGWLVSWFPPSASAECHLSQNINWFISGLHLSASLLPGTKSTREVKVLLLRYYETQLKCLQSQVSNLISWTMMLTTCVWPVRAAPTIARMSLSWKSEPGEWVCVLGPWLQHCSTAALTCTSAWKSSIRRFVSTEKARTRAFSWLKADTTAFTFKTLLRHYSKRALTPWSLNVKLGRRRKSHKGRAVNSRLT